MSASPASTRRGDPGRAERIVIAERISGMAPPLGTVGGGQLRGTVLSGDDVGACPDRGIGQVLRALQVLDPLKDRNLKPVLGFQLVRHRKPPTALEGRHTIRSGREREAGCGGSG